MRLTSIQPPRLYLPRRLTHFWLLLIALNPLLMGCDNTLLKRNVINSTVSTPSTTTSEMGSTATQALRIALRQAAPDERIRHHINRGARLQQADDKGVTPLMQIALSRSPELLQWSIAQAHTARPSAPDHNADAPFSDSGDEPLSAEWALDALALMNAIYALPSPTPHRYADALIEISGQTSLKFADNAVSLTLSEAQRLVTNRVTLQSYHWQQTQFQQSEAWRDFVDWRRKMTEQLTALNQPIATIPEPTLPPVSRFEKDPFETLQMFEQRMAAAKAAREQQVAAQIADYRRRVEARNQQVMERKPALTHLRQQIEAQRAIHQQRLAKHQQQIADQAEQLQGDWIASAIAMIYGSPYLQAIADAGQPKYDAERGRLYARFGFSHLTTTQEVVITVTAGDPARDLYQRLRSGISPTAHLQLAQASGRVTLTAVTVDVGGTAYQAQLNDERYRVNQPLVAIIRSEQQLPQLNQSTEILSPLNTDALTQRSLQLQNPYLKDVLFDAYLLQQEQSFEDDIPQQLARLSAAPIDKRNWLFVIGIERYDQTDNVRYARRSAEWFAKVAAKRFGIHPSRQVILLDERASSGQIEDQLKLLLSKVQAGDRILFYYAGHGLPVVEEGNRPYLLPADKIPDFIADNRFYRADQLYQRLEGSAASAVIAFMDSCFTGASDGRSLFGDQKAATRLVPRLPAIAADGKLAVFTAGTDKQYANALPEMGHRLFSYYLIKGLLQHPAQMADLARQVGRDVREKSFDLGGLNRQTPVLMGNGDLPLFVADSVR